MFPGWTIPASRLFGFRFGANIAVRLAYLEAQNLKAVACLGPVVHSLLSDPLRQGRVPEMYLDVLASRLGMHDASDEALRVELNRYSLKTQGLLGRRCPDTRCFPATGITILSARRKSHG